MEAASSTIWVTGCRSWYLDDRGIPMVWPWSFHRFREEMRAPDMADDEVRSAGRGRRRGTGSTIRCRRSATLGSMASATRSQEPGPARIPAGECPACSEAVPMGHEAEAWCACGDLVADHGAGGDEPCEVCGCGVFEWDGRPCCPACFADLDGGDAVAPVRARRTRAA